MSDLTPESDDQQAGPDEFACPNCGVLETITLTRTTSAPQCRCGARLQATRDPGPPRALDVRGETVLDESCTASVPLPSRYEGPGLVQGRGGFPEEATDEQPEYLPLDHPHTEPDCPFCAARQAPTLHRLWCAVFFARDCNCGYAGR